MLDPVLVGLFLFALLVFIMGAILVALLTRD